MIRRIINKVKREQELKHRRLNTQSVFQELDKYTEPAVGKMLEVIKAVSDDQPWTTEEQQVFAEIDELSTSYLQSKREIETIDYGAGEAKDTRSLSEQHEGIKAIEKISEIHRLASSSALWGKLIFKIIREYRPSKALELGTCLGISAAYQLQAMKLNQQGMLITLEGAPGRAAIAEESLKSFGYPHFEVITGRFSDTLPGVLSQHPSIDLAFIDGHHDEHATKEYFEMLYPYLSDQCVLIFDDIHWSQGMINAWNEICSDERTRISFDLYYWGICLVDKQIERKQHFELGL